MTEKRLTIALAGNANVGKSVIFNYLTGLHQHIGNWPGKTVERAEGTLHFKGRVPYCLARRGLEARLSTAAYVQLCDFVEETGEGFTLVVNGERFVLPPQGT